MQTACAVPRLCRDSQQQQPDWMEAPLWSPGPGRDRVGGLAGSGRMPEGSEEAGAVSLQTWGFPCCGSGSLLCCHQGLGAAEACLEASWVLPSVLLPALPRNVKWHFCSAAVTAAAQGASPNASSLSPALPPSPSTCPQPGAGDWQRPLSWLGMCLPLAVAASSPSPGGDAAARAACAVVGQLLRMGILGEQRHAPRLDAGDGDGHACPWGWWISPPWEEMGDGGQAPCSVAVLVVSPGQVVSSEMSLSQSQPGCGKSRLLRGL